MALLATKEGEELGDQKWIIDLRTEASESRTNMPVSYGRKD
jgi:hypothetical protein